MFTRDEWREISIGDYVLSGGELAAAVLVDAVVRLLPGVISDPESAGSDSFEDGLLDAPYYTRPEEIEGLRVPDPLLSGHHVKIHGVAAGAAQDPHARAASRPVARVARAASGF